MVLLAFGEPIALVIIYASLGALFLPFLAITLLLLLNSSRVAPEYRNRLVTNVLLAVSVIPFIVVGVQEVLGVWEAERETNLPRQTLPPLTKLNTTLNLSSE